MPTRKFNFTDRRKLNRKHIGISVAMNEEGTISFNAELELDSYELPPEAQVYIEAYRQTQRKRFDCGIVGRFSLPLDRSLDVFDSVEGILFRVMVIANEGNLGLLLAEAEQLKPSDEETIEGKRIPLLPVVYEAHLVDQVFNVDFSGDYPILQVNSSVTSGDTLINHPAFFSLVYPAVLRELLTRILFGEDTEVEEDDDGWQARFLRFASALPGVEEPPVSDEEDEPACFRWVDTAVSSFCRHANIMGRFNQFWGEEA